MLRYVTFCLTMLTVAQATRISWCVVKLNEFRNERNAQRSCPIKSTSSTKSFMNLIKTTGNLLRRVCIPAKFAMKHASHIQSRSVIIWVRFLC